jgi:hypothetical protein
MSQISYTQIPRILLHINLEDFREPSRGFLLFLFLSNLLNINASQRTIESVLLLVSKFVIFTKTGKMVLKAVPTCCSMGMSCFSKHSCILTGRLSNTYKITNQSNYDSTSPENLALENKKKLNNTDKVKQLTFSQSI